MRLASAQCVLGIVQYDDAADGLASVQQAASQLRGLYAPVLGDDVAVVHEWLPDIRTGLVIVGAGIEQPLSWPVVWGRAIDATGDATSTSVSAAVREPGDLAQTMTGYFVLASYAAGTLRLCTSATLTHTLKRVRGSRATAWATRGWAAHVLAGRSPRLNEAAVAEFVVLGYALGSDELLADTTVLPDASVVDITASGFREWELAPLSDRVTPGPATTATELRHVLGARLLPTSRVEGAALGLTAGRDSTLLASCLVESGGRVDTFTFGNRWYADVAGARAAARAAHLPHRVVNRSYPGLSWPRMAELSVWTEGMQAASALLEPTNDWTARDVVHLVGSGAEIGRAFYYKGSDPRGWFDVFAADIRERMAPEAAETFLGRLDADLTQLATFGRDPGTTIDLLYSTKRMGKWLLRGLPSAPIRDVVAGYLAPDVVRALLNVSPDDKASGAIFDHAHAIAPVNLHQRATTAAHRFARVRARLGRRTAVQPMQELATALRTMPHRSETARLLGRDWLRTTLQRAGTHQYARQHAWHLLAVEALVEALNA